MTFTDAVREAECDQLIEACRVLCLGRDDVAYIVARHRRSPALFDLVLVLGGGIGDYVRMVLRARPPLVFGRST